VLEVHRLVESVEQSFPGTEYDGAIDIDSSSTYPALRARRISSAPPMTHTSLPAAASRPGDRFVKPVHECESGVGGLVFRTVRSNEERQGQGG
jgi:hypothetical protein